MTGWRIDGEGDSGTRAIHYPAGRGRTEYNVHRGENGGWCATARYDDGRERQFPTESTEAGAQARCEFDAAATR